MNIVEILNHRAELLSYEENYRYAYNLVLYRAGDTLYKGACKLIAENLDKLAEQDIKSVFPSGSSDNAIQQSQESELLLKAVRKVWDDFTTSLLRLRDILRYMVSILSVSLCYYRSYYHVRIECTRHQPGCPKHGIPVY